MLVDDAIKNPRKKREALLNPKFKYIGISASDVNISQEEKDKKKEEDNGNNINNENNNNQNNQVNNENNQANNGNIIVLSDIFI